MAWLPLQPLLSCCVLCEVHVLGEETVRDRGSVYCDVRAEMKKWLSVGYIMQDSTVGWQQFDM